MKSLFFATLASFLLPSFCLLARSWNFPGIPQPVEAELVGVNNDGVVLRGSNGKSFEVPFGNFSPADQNYLRLLEAGEGKEAVAMEPGKPIASHGGCSVKSVESCVNQVVEIKAGSEAHITGSGDPATGSTFQFTASDGWLFFDRIAPSVVASKFVGRMLVNGARAAIDSNLRVVQHGAGTVVIPHGSAFPAMTAFEGESLTSTQLLLQSYVKYGDAQLVTLKNSMSSFILRRGYTATIASRENGTGVSRNYVAQDHDLEIATLPAGLDNDVRFVRIFPWRWVSKKGVAGGIWQKLDVGWFYDWNIAADSSLDLEYVPIRQKRSWPGLDQDWKKKGSTHLLGYNEPDRPDQANMTVEEAISG